MIVVCRAKLGAGQRPSRRADAAFVVAENRLQAKIFANRPSIIDADDAVFKAVEPLVMTGICLAPFGVKRAEPRRAAQVARAVVREVVRTHGSPPAAD